MTEEQAKQYGDFVRPNLCVTPMLHSFYRGGVIGCAGEVDGVECIFSLLLLECHANDSIFRARLGWHVAQQVFEIKVSDLVVELGSPLTKVSTTQEVVSLKTLTVFEMKALQCGFERHRCSYKSWTAEHSRGPPTWYAAPIVGPGDSKQATKERKWLSS